MTHDQLRNLINKYDAAGMVDEPAVKALRAVVELHRPDLQGRCDICTWIIGKPGFVLYGVCPTIRAIEKELK